jgi:hypothetical protein
MNIFGESFNEKIIQQIKVREAIYGSKNRSTKELSYINSRTGWVKLVSSVDIDPSQTNRLKILGINDSDLTQNNLAKKFVLFNGVSENQQNEREGIYGRGPTVNNDAAYGIGGLEFGLRAMPGILSADITTLNRGSIKRATVQIKANNRTQFEIIDLLYLRLGFPILLEWGHSSYLETSTGDIKDPKAFSLENDFLNYNNTSASTEDGAFTQFLAKIHKNRIESYGNYDAMLAKTVNFNWTFEKDGTYNVTLSLISVGDIIESLKMNTLSGGIQTNTTVSDDPNAEPKSIIQTSAKKHDIGHLLDVAQKLIAPTPKTVGGMQAYSFPETLPLYYTGKIDVVSQEWSGGHKTEYYYRLGSFLKWIEKRKLLYDKKSGKPLINIDYDDANYIYFDPYQASTNPNVCIIRNDIPNLGYNLFSSCEKFEFSPTKNTRVGILMNAYINFDFLLTKIDSLVDAETGKVTFIDLLTAICNGISDSLGNKNLIEPIIDEVTNTVKLIDSTSIPNSNDILTWLKANGFADKITGSTTEIAKFNLYGYYGIDADNTAASFIHDFSLSTGITPNLATMLTVGATSNGQVVGEDSTAFSKWNSGLKNRLTAEIVDGSYKTQPDPAEPTLEEKFRNSVKEYIDFLKDLDSTSKYPTWDDSKMSTYSNILSSLIEYRQAITSKKQVDNNGSLSIGFIPINLSLTMDGLSGMKVYELFTVDTSFLPYNYPTAYNFLIKTITNTIRNSVWTTTLETMASTTKPPLVENIPIDRVATREPSQGAGNASAVRGNPDLKFILQNTGYNPGTAEYELALIIGTIEGWNANQNGGIGSRSYRNNNLGNLDYSDSLRVIDPKVTLEKNPYGPSRFAHFTTPELGAKALVEKKIKQWARGSMPITETNKSFYKRGQKPTIRDFIYTYAPPNENNTQGYLNTIISNLKSIDPKINQDTVLLTLLV